MNETKTLSDQTHARKQIYFYIRVLLRFHIPVCTWLNIIHGSN